MTNLKKSLALVVALVMLLGMFSMAAAFSDVPSDYDFTSELTMLSDLGILSGYPDGTFKPDATITRAEACAVIYRMLSGKTAAANFVGATAFSDVAADNWASGYVNYCSELGVVVGYPDGTFLPNKPVSFAEFCTMLVRALGLDTGKLSFPFGYLAVADMNKVTDEIDLVPSDAASRGAVAKLAYNAIMNATYARIATEDNKNPTIAEDVLKLKNFEDTVTGINGYGAGDTDDGEIYLDDNDVTIEFDKDSDILGLNVKVWYKGTEDADGNPDEIDKVYAVVPKSSESVTLNMVDITYEGEGEYSYNDGDDEIALDEGALTYINMTAGDVDGEIADNGETRTLQKVKFVNTDDDDAYELAFLTGYEFGKVTRVSSSTIYFDGATPDDLDLEDADGEATDVTYPSGLKKDDRVLIYREADDNAVVTLIPKSVGTLTTINGSTYTIGGTNYKLEASVAALAANTLGKSYDYYVDSVFGYIVADSTTAATEKVLYIKDTTTFEDDWGNDVYKAKVVLPDGTSKQMDFADADEFGVAALGGAGLYLYALNSDGELKDVVAMTVDADGVPEKDGALLDVDGIKYTIASDSILFFVEGTDVYAYQGTLPSFTDGINADVDLKTGTSFRTVKYAVVNVDNLSAGTANEDVIGFATSCKLIAIDDEYAAQYSIAAKGAVKTYDSVSDEDSAVIVDDFKVAAGNFVKFDIDEDGKISAMALAELGALESGAEVEVGYVFDEEDGQYDVRYALDANYENLVTPVYLSLADEYDVYNIDIDDKTAEVGIADDIAFTYTYDGDDDNTLIPVYFVLDEGDIAAAFVSADEGADGKILAQSLAAINAGDGVEADYIIVGIEDYDDLLLDDYNDAVVAARDDKGSDLTAAEIQDVVDEVNAIV